MLLMERRPIPLFRDPSRPTSPELTDAALAETEAALGVTLPPAYVELLRAEANGGRLRRSHVSGTDVTIPELLGVGGPRGVAALQVVAQGWRYPVTPSVMIATAGPQAVLLDYRTGDTPSVVFVDMTAGPRVETLGDDFATFAARLVVGDPTHDWVFARAFTLRDARARLTEAGWSEDEAHYGIYRFARDGARLEIKPNQERDTEGLFFAEYPEAYLIARLEGSAEEADALEALFEGDALRIHSAHAADT